MIEFNKDSVEIESSEQLAGFIVGKVVQSVVREEDSKESWPQNENCILITFSDGSQLYIGAWGYDASGVTAHLSTHTYTREP